jgi:hypothetical protein
MKSTTLRRALLLLADNVQHVPAPIAHAVLRPLILAAQQATIAALAARAKAKRARASRASRHGGAAAAKDLQKLIDVQRERITRTNQTIAERRRRCTSKRRRLHV